jgi:hypothetical protein
MAAPQKPKSTDTVFHPASATTPDGRTTIQDPGKQFTRTIVQSGVPTLMADIVRSNDAVEPTWSDRAHASADLPYVPVVPGH